MKDQLVCRDGGLTARFTSAAAAQTGIMQTLYSGGMPTYVLISVELGKAALFSAYSDFLSPPADASLMHVTGKKALLLNVAGRPFVRYKEVTAGAVIYVTPLANH